MKLDNKKCEAAITYPTTNNHLLMVIAEFKIKIHSKDAIINSNNNQNKAQRKSIKTRYALTPRHRESLCCFKE